MQQSGFHKVKLQTTGISLSHYQISKGKKDTAHIMHISLDEKLRSRIAKSLILQWIKKISNVFLTSLSIGMTLKAFYVKK